MNESLEALCNYLWHRIARIQLPSRRLPFHLTPFAPRAGARMAPARTGGDTHWHCAHLHRTCVRCKCGGRAAPVQVCPEPYTCTPFGRTAHCTCDAPQVRCRWVRCRWVRGTAPGPFACIPERSGGTPGSCSHYLSGEDLPGEGRLPKDVSLDLHPLRAAPQRGEAERDKTRTALHQCNWMRGILAYVLARFIHGLADADASGAEAEARRAGAA